MKVGAIYTGLQSLPPSTGVPSLFVDLSGFSGKEPKHMNNDKIPKVSGEYPTDQIFNSITGLLTEHLIRNVVFTGGEPLFQRHHVYNLAENLIRNGMFVEIDTTGFIKPEVVLGSSVMGVQWNVAPLWTDLKNPYIKDFLMTGRAYVRLKINPYDDHGIIKKRMEELKVFIDTYSSFNVADRIYLIPEEVPGTEYVDCIRDTFILAKMSNTKVAPVIDWNSAEVCAEQP